MGKIYVFLLAVLTGIFLNISFQLNKIDVVAATKIQKTEYNEYITTSGEFESSEATEIILSYPICIKEVFVKENRFVNQGQALFSMDIERMKSIAAGNIDSDLLQMISTQENVINDDNLKFISNVPEIVYASDNGVVSQLNIYPGAVMLQNSPILTISHSGDIVARFTLTQQDYGKISVGDRVEIIPVAYSNVEYKGNISDKTAVITKRNTAFGNKVTVEVFADINNRDSKISEGLQINGKIKSGETQYINALDYSYINRDEAGEYVYILKNGLPEKAYVKTGVETENFIEILTSFPENTIFLKGHIKEGNRVIISGNNF